MKGIAIATLVFTIIGVVVACFAVCIAKRLNKAVLRQNLEIELNRTEIELKDVEAQIERAKTEGNAQTANIYGVQSSNPRVGEIFALMNKQNALEKRKAEIQTQLNELKQ